MSWYKGVDGTGTLSGGRVTLCGSNGASDCIALRVLPDGKIGLSRSEDDGSAGDYEARHQVPAEGGPAVELAFEPHEIAQFALAIARREAPRDVLRAIDEDMARQAALSRA